MKAVNKIYSCNSSPMWKSVANSGEKVCAQNFYKRWFCMIKLNKSVREINKELTHITPFFQPLVVTWRKFRSCVCQLKDSTFPNNLGRGHHGVEHNTFQLREYKSFVADVERTCNKLTVVRGMTCVPWGTQLKVVVTRTHVCRGAHIHTYHGDRQKAVMTVTIL